MTTLRYFAYGSNLLLARLRERVPSAVARGPARLPGHRLAWHMVGRDGSGKCDVVVDADAEVHGVVYDLPVAERAALDRAESLGVGYAEDAIVVEFDGAPLTVMTYRALMTREGLAPFRWYRDLVIAGALEHRLPDAYIADLRAVAVIDDPDPGRAARHRGLIDGDAARAGSGEST